MPVGTPYNMTAFGASTNLLDMFSAMNVATGGLLVNLTLAVIFIVIVIMTIQRNPAPESFVAASVVMSIISLTFAAIGLTNYLAVIIFAVILGGSLIALYKSNSV